MRWIPTPPTDNLYKYAAITGLWMVLGVSALFAYVIYNSYAMKDHAELSMQIMRSEAWIGDIDKRIKSLEAGALDENRLEGLSEGRTTEQELNLLHSFKNFTQPRLDERKKMAEANDPGNALRWLDRAYVYVWLPFSLAGSIAIVIYGFLRWRRFQKVTDRLQDLDVQLKETQLREARVPRRWKR